MTKTSNVPVIPYDRSFTVVRQTEREREKWKFRNYSRVLTEFIGHLLRPLKCSPFKTDLSFPFSNENHMSHIVRKNLYIFFFTQKIDFFPTFVFSFFSFFTKFTQPFYNLNKIFKNEKVGYKNYDSCKKRYLYCLPAFPKKDIPWYCTCQNVHPQFQVCISIITLTLSQTSPGFYVSAVKVFSKHRAKRRNYS